MIYKLLLCLSIKTKTNAKPKIEEIKIGAFELISSFLAIHCPSWVIKYITKPIWKASPE